MWQNETQCQAATQAERGVRAMTRVMLPMMDVASLVERLPEGAALDGTETHGDRPMRPFSTKVQRVVLVGLLALTMGLPLATPVVENWAQQRHIAGLMAGGGIKGRS